MHILAWVLASVVGGGIALAITITLFRSGKPVRALIGSAAQGLAALAAVNLTGAFTGISLGLGIFSGSVAAALGVPGVITLLMLKTIW